MNMNSYIIISPNELNHHGVKGMRWGVRKRLPLVSGNSRRQPAPNQDIYQRKMQRRAKAKKVAKVGGVIALAALASYGAYKLSKNPQALQKGKDFLNYKILKKSKPFTPAELKKMGISTFEPATFKPRQSMHGKTLSGQNNKKFAVPNKKLVGYSRKQTVVNTASKNEGTSIKEVPIKQIPVKEIPVKQIPVKEIPIKQIPVSKKAASTPVKDASKQLKKYYGNLDPVKDDYYDFMNEVLKGIK